MATLTTGEKLDDKGDPIPGTGFEYESDGAVADLLALRTSPILYSPPQGEWVWMIPDESNGKNERCVAVCPTGNKGPQAHYHPAFDEHFKAITGSWALKADAEELSLNAGEDIVVRKGVKHTYRCVGDEGEFGVVEIDIIPAVGFEGMMRGLMGQQQEGVVNSRGDMPFLQAMVALRGYRTSLGLSFSEIAIMVPPGKSVMALLGVLSIFIAPIGRLLGYRADYPHYYEDEFWEKRVNQPLK